MKTANGKEWDYVIVGAGSAGCALAYELARTGRNSVLMIESGGSNRSPYIKIPGYVAHAGKQFDWGYVCQPDPSRAGRSEPWRRGHVLGGSSSINGTAFVRGAPRDYDRWAAMGAVGWSYADVLPIFREMEASDQPGPIRGKQGPLAVRTVMRAHPLTEAFLASAVQAGFVFNPDYNGSSQEGVAYLQLSQRCGLRCSSADAFVTPLLQKPNFRLLLNARVDRIELDASRATGIEITRNGASEFIPAQRVILSAGALNTPKLLMLSGIGDPQELERVGIRTRVRAPAVGRHLQDHPLVRLVYRTRIPSHNLTEGLSQKLKIAAEFARYREGPIAAPIESVAFLKTSPQTAHPDIQLHFMPIGLLNVSENDSPILKYPSVSVYVNKNYSRSEGRLRLASANSLDAPLIECRLLDDSDDLSTLVEGIGVVRKVMACLPMRELIEGEVAPGAAHRSEADLRRYIPPNTEICYHPIGTCRMGSEDGAVVSPKLRVNGVENLWIADASVIPSHLSGNINAACMMIGMKLGRELARHA